MAGILVGKKEIKLDVDLLKILQPTNAGVKWTSARQRAYEEIDSLIQIFNGHVFSAINGSTDYLHEDLIPLSKWEPLRARI